LIVNALGKRSQLKVYAIGQCNDDLYLAERKQAISKLLVKFTRFVNQDKWFLWRFITAKVLVL